jgi:2-polyprenyl-3-methyl-5-hydroxy-6-metoxy-1,4-benzoquinol methylase
LGNQAVKGENKCQPVVFREAGVLDSKGDGRRCSVSSILDKLFVRRKHVCPSWLCFTFDNPLRRIFQDPYKILSPYIKPGYTVVDIGPGKGYFTIPMCKLVGRKGRVIATDIQEKMLRALHRRASEAGLAANLTTNFSKPNDFCLDVKADFVLAFWMVHEVPELMNFFVNVKEIMKPEALFLIAEPLFHVTRRSFNITLRTAQEMGFKIVDRPEISFSYAAMLAL